MLGGRLQPDVYSWTALSIPSPLWQKHVPYSKYINKPFEKPSGCDVGELKSTLCACSHICFLYREAKLFSYTTKPWPIFKRLGTVGNLSPFCPSLLYPLYPLPQQCLLAGSPLHLNHRGGHRHGPGFTGEAGAGTPRHPPSVGYAVMYNTTCDELTNNSGYEALWEWPVLKTC